MNGPRLAASDNRLGPYFARRWGISAASRPVSVLVFSRRTTSSAARACHAVASLPVVEIVAAFICNPPLGPCRLVARGPYSPEAILSDSARRHAWYRAASAHESVSRRARAV